MEIHKMNSFKLIMMTAVLLVLGACSEDKNEPSPKAEEQIVDTTPLKKSVLTEEDLQDLSVWRFYERTHWMQNPEVIGYSEDGRFYARIGVVDPRNDSNACYFHMISKVEFETADNVTKMKFVGEPEFVFYYGLLFETENKEVIDSFNDPAKKEHAEKYCFESVKLENVKSLFAPQKTSSVTDFDQMISRTDSEVIFGLLKPTKKAATEALKDSRFKRMKPSQWEEKQNCASAESTCLP